MTVEPRHGPILARDVREVARRQAQSVSSGLVIALATGAALMAVVVFVLLDYHFDQQVHRLFKIAAGLGGALFIVLQPQVGLWLLPVLAPFLSWTPQLPVPGLNAINALLLAAFGTFVVGRTLERRSWMAPAGLGWPILLFLLIAGLSIVRGAAFPTGYEYEAGKNAVQLFRTATSFAPYFIALFMMSGSRHRGWLLSAIVLGLVLEAAITPTFGQWMGSRAMGTMAQPNVLGAFFAISSTIVAAMLLAQRRWYFKVPMALAVLGGAYGVMLSVSRGALMALAVGLLYVALRSSRVLTFVILAILVTSPLWAPQNVKERVLATMRPVEESSDESELEGSAQARIDTWNAAIRIWSEHPIEGVGFAGLGYVLRSTGERLGLEHTKDSPHNSFVRVLGEMGLIGITVFLLLFWKSWTLARDGLRAARDRFERQLAIALGAATLVVAVNCWFGDRFFELDIMCAFWVLAAMVNGVVNETRGRRA